MSVNKNKVKDNIGIQKQTEAYQTFERKSIISLNFFFWKKNNETNKQKQSISLNTKKESPRQSAWNGLQSKAMTKNPIFHNLN